MAIFFLSLKLFFQILKKYSKLCGSKNLSQALCFLHFETVLLVLTDFISYRSIFLRRKLCSLILPHAFGIIHSHLCSVIGVTKYSWVPRHCFQPWSGNAKDMWSFYGNRSNIQSIRSQPWRAWEEKHAISMLLQPVFAKLVKRVGGGKKMTSELEYHLAWRKQLYGPSARNTSNWLSSTSCPRKLYVAVEAVRQNVWGNQKDSRKAKIGHLSKDRR